MYGKECKRKFGTSDSTFFVLHFRICRRTLEHIMYMNALGQPIIVLHSFKAAFELLNWRANIYSDHPRSIVPQDILCEGLFTALMPYGDMIFSPENLELTVSFCL